MHDGGVHDVAWESVATDALASHARFWELLPQAQWHGFEHVRPGFAISELGLYLWPRLSSGI